jgi:hypothetical protein
MARPYIMKKGVSMLSDLKDGLSSLLPIGVGKIFYVNGIDEGGFEDGSDSNDGLTMDHPLLTITKALSYCVDYRNDYIVVLDYYQATGETWPIPVNKCLVSIVSLNSIAGVPMGGPMVPWCVVVASGNYSAFDFTAGNNLLQGFAIYGGSASYPGITFDSGAYAIHIHQNRFCQGNYGIYSTTDDLGYGISVTDNWFQNGLAAGGLVFGDDPAHCYIAGNHFDRLEGVSINVVAGGGTVIENNYIALPTGYSAGDAITLGASVSRAFVNNNYAASGEAYTGGNAPYVDNGTVANNAWGRNYYGHTVAMPT